MHVGRAIGYGLLALVDAVVPTVVAVGITWFALLGHDVGGVSGFTLGLVAGAAAFGLTLVASTVSHYRGGKPFAFTRLARTALHYVIYWPPWSIGRRRRR